MNMKPIDTLKTAEPFESLLPSIEDGEAVQAIHDDQMFYIQPSAFDGYFWVAVTSRGSINYLSRPFNKVALGNALRGLGFHSDKARVISRGKTTPFESCPWHRKGDKKYKERLVDIYFIQSIIGGPIKIGLSKSTTSRVTTIETMCPFKLMVLGILKNVNFRMENKLHRHFAATRLHGEWFKPTPELLDYINGLEN